MRTILIIYRESNSLVVDLQGKATDYPLCLHLADGVYERYDLDASRRELYYRRVDW